MSAIVCGKRSFLEELTTPPVSKKIRCSSSPVRFSSLSSASSALSATYLSSSDLVLDQLSAIFPRMDKQVLVGVLEKCNGDLDLAIQSLNNLQLGSTEITLDSATGKSTALHEDGNCSRKSVTEDGPVEEGLSWRVDGMDWVELFVGEMTSASNMDDARVRAARVVEALKMSIYSCADEEATKAAQQENLMLKEKIEALIQENGVLKRAVAIQYERQKEFEDKDHELQHLKQLLSQCQEQLRRLEVNNYALTVHLKQAQPSNSIPGRFHPDVF